jgi:hypothetical protein
MQIQLNSDNHIVGSPGLAQRLQADLEHELRHVASAITRVEVHLNDVNGSKSGPDDKRCMLEARIKGAQPLAVESRAPTIEQAVNAAAGQLYRAVKTSLDKSASAEKRSPSVRHTSPDSGDE